MRGLKAMDIKRTGTTASKLASMRERIEQIEVVREIIKIAGKFSGICYWHL